LSGIEATQTIRQLNDEKKSKVLIIAMTASVLREETDNYIRNGMDGFVPKPFKIEQLMGEIRRLTSKT
jgi:CheY-like chemotaxis protein